MIDLPRGVRLSDSRQEYGSEYPLPLLVVETAQCRAIFALQGAQLLSFSPVGDADWLWLSPKASFTPGAAIRGGIPLCLPWFGVNRRFSGLPKHGFVRQRAWQLLEAANDGAELVLCFATESTVEERALFPWAYSVQAEYRLGHELRCGLQIRNLSEQYLPLSFALHSYFAADTSLASVQGLGSGAYLDNTQGLAPSQLDGKQIFDGEIDRVFEGVGGTQRLTTGGGEIEVSGRDCDTVVVWNPGVSLASTIGDIAEHYCEYICVERGMAFADEVSLAPGGSYSALMHVCRCVTVSVQAV